MFAMFFAVFPRFFSGLFSNIPHSVSWQATQNRDLYIRLSNGKIKELYEDGQMIVLGGYANA
jgi:hypothetical protein